MKPQDIDRRTVQLRHELPDGTWHVDWLLARDAEGALVTFRLADRIDTLTPEAVCDAERIGDHRRAYLDYEGPIAGGRGTVRRLCTGRIEQWREAEQAWTLRIRWDEPALCQALRVEPCGGASWRVRMISTDADGRPE